MVQRMATPPTHEAITMTTVIPAFFPSLDDISPETEELEDAVEDAATDSVSVTRTPDITLVIGSVSSVAVGAWVT